MLDATATFGMSAKLAPAADIPAHTIQCHGLDLREQCAKRAEQTWMGMK